MSTTNKPTQVDDPFAREATDEERAQFRPLTDAEFRQALREGEEHRAAVESVGQSADIAPRLLFR
jgi:hypothetical protein